MANSNPESFQWLSVTEDSLFLHDGLLRVTDLVELPPNVETFGSRDNEVVSFDSKDPGELCSKLLEICSTRNDAFSTILEYRLNALKGLWKAQRISNQDDQSERDASSQDEAIALLKKQGLIKDSDQAPFSTRISLLLILPLLQSQSKTDPSLSTVTSGVILACLKDCPPLSLAKEPSDCLNGLESLLCGWLGERDGPSGRPHHAVEESHRENAAAALVALACARGHVKTFIHAIDLLQQLGDIPPLQVSDILSSLLECEGGQGQITSLLGSKYILSWGVDDLLGCNGTENVANDGKESNDKDKDKDQELGRSITTDGLFIYTTNNCGRGIAKIGTGLQGTLRGYVYTKNTETGPGRLALGGDCLLLRPQKFDAETEVDLLVQLINKSTLEVLKVIPKPKAFIHAGPCTTVGFCSDGLYCYWLWCPALVQDKNTKNVNVNVCTFMLEKDLEVRQLRPNLILQRKEETSTRSMNEAILNRLRPLRGSNSAATLMALTGGEALIPSRKEETQSAGSTTCGVNLRTLVRTPVFSDGNHIVLLTTPPGAAPGGAGRSLFGGGGPISSLRSLASNMCFSAKTGLFSARIDLVEAHTSSLGRGTAITGLATCYDIVNNLIWVLSGEYMDQFHNPSSLPPHHVHLRLGITETALPIGLGGNAIPVDLVVSSLLHNVSSMCLHQMTNTTSAVASGRSVVFPQDQTSLLIASSSGGTSNVGGYGSTAGSEVTGLAPLDLLHMSRVTNILARAVADKDTQAVICCLVVLEHIFRTSSPHTDQNHGAEQMRTTRNLIWNLLTNCPLGEEDETLLRSVKTESCHVITVGLQSLYPTQHERHALLYQLLTTGNENISLVELRDMILTEFSTQLSQQMPSAREDNILQLSDDLVHFVLKLAVKESCSLLKSAQTSSKENFHTKISNLPIASPAVQYLTALRSYYLKCAVLYESSTSGEDNTSDNGEGSSLPDETIQVIQAKVLSLSSKMIEGACEVLERYLETCTAVLGGLAAAEATISTTTTADGGRGSLGISGGVSSQENLEMCLSMLERVAKSTVLGSLMPVLVTSLTHPNLRCLGLAGALMPSLVTLSLLTSQAALLLKNQEMAASTNSVPSPDTDLGSTSDMADLIGETISNKYDEEGDEGFLTGIKIPTPWASGKTVETIHPVRDNYKFKETVHIPGARCLYLRFDPRCSSQYDYDKVIVYAGPGIQGKKVVEYGGNSFGYGSRSVLGNGWPKDLVKIEGDTVTLTFEMRSGREHNTPDKAMWGFACTIRAQESAEEVTPGLPFLSDLALGLSVLVCTQLAILYHGTPPSQDELDCRHLLKSKILQRCAWPAELHSSEKTQLASKSASLSPPQAKKTSGKIAGVSAVQQPQSQADSLPRIKLSPTILDRLRKMAKRQQLVRLRPSVRHVLQPELLEESVVSAVLKHLGLEDLVLDLAAVAGRPGGKDELAALSTILEEIYRRFDVLLRKLQVMAELEKRWEIEVEDHVVHLMESTTPMKHPPSSPPCSNVSSTNNSNSSSGSSETIVFSGPEPPFFHDYHLQELRHKELALLAFLKDVPVDLQDLEATTKSLLGKFEASTLALKEKRINNQYKQQPEEQEHEEETTDSTSLPKTRQVVLGVLSRLELLLQVSSVHGEHLTSGLPRTISTCSADQAAEQQHQQHLMARSDTDVVRPGQPFSRSLSAPVGGMTVVTDLADWKQGVQHRWRHPHKHKHARSGADKMAWSAAALLSDLFDEGDDCQGDGDRPPQLLVIDQLFAFIGSDPEKAVSCQSFLRAAKERRRRGESRKVALGHIKDLLAAAARVGGATHLVAAAAAVLRHGPRVEELLCGGMVEQVREAFAQAMAAVVQLAAQNPMASASSIGLLCTIPYTRAEEKCLVRSGLVHLLDRLCSLGNHRADGLGTETQTPRQKVSTLAWAGFQVLASRCVKWENEDEATACSHVEELEHSGLAKQVSMLLTHHLARATEGIGNAMAGTEALQEVLSLLNNLSRSKMGKAILSQPACVSKLLSLLLDQRPSPKLVLIILQLCRVSLPLMNTVDCEDVELPAWGQQLYQSHWSSAQPVADPPARIVCLLLAKLGDFLVPGDQVLLSSRSPSLESSGSGRPKPGDSDKLDDLDVQRGRLSVFVHKRQDQLSHDIIQPLLNCDTRPPRLAGNANMEKVRALDREINKSGKAELTTEDAVNAFKKAFKWAQLGLIISTAPPTDSSPVDSSNGSDKKKMASEVICKEKNSELARTDPVRAFISGHVANAMAAEVITLLHNLLSAQTSSTAHTWAQAVQRVLANALSGLPVLLGSLDGLPSPRSPRGTSTASTSSSSGGGAGAGSGGQSTNQLMSLAKLANAALCALGGFQETLKPGCEVKVTGEGVRGTYGTVVSVSEQNDVVTVQLNFSSGTDGDVAASASVAGVQDIPPTYSDTVKVPLARVQPVRNQMFCKQQPEMADAFLSAAKTVVLPPDEPISPLSQTLHCSGDGNSMANQICRVVAEIRTRTSIVLATCLQDIHFAKAFIEECGYSIDMLKSLAKDCDTGSRLPVLDSHCHRLRMLYRDCAKPPPPPCRTDIRPSKEMVWDVQRPFPPTRACLFSHGMTSVTFMGDPSAGVGLPRGTMVYANQPIPKEAPSFYWELEVASFGESQDESGAVVSFGFAPPVEKKDGAWTNPIGTCLFLNNGKAVHYNGSSLLQWRSVRLEVTVGAGDVAGIGWERSGDNADSGQTPKGQVYFTYNGQRLSSFLDSVSGALYPVVHIQKKGCRVKANFGARPFAYAEGQQHRDAAEEANDVLRDIRESFNHLPFHGLMLGGASEDSESDSAETSGPGSAQGSAGAVPGLSDSRSSPPKVPCLTPQPQPTQKEYSTEASQTYKLLPSFDNFVLTGPDSMFSRPSEEDSDDETATAAGDESQQLEDHYALLVKAWEQKVFPVIRRRFRNEAERKDGLEQIRGALQLGMTDIARQTVEFLYEENGGIPRDLHLPTIDDIKEDLAKFTIDRVKKGTTVNIRMPAGMGGGTASASTGGGGGVTGTNGAVPGTTSNATMQLPKFAVRSMLKTFGLTGTVLDVDTASELVQVETYLRSEGVLVRFWYPLIMLEKPAQGMRKASITGGQTMDTSNIYIHRELLSTESMLARMHLRTAFLRLTDHCNSPAMEVTSCSTSLGSSMAACAATLQELDLENIQLLSEHLLSAPMTTGTLEATSPFQTRSLSQLSLVPAVSLPGLVYRNSLRLKRQLATAIARASNQGEDYLIELTNQLCMCLQTAPEMFPYLAFPVNETKVSTDVHFTGAACILVSCIKVNDTSGKETPPYRAPWARISTYTGKRIRKSGQVTRQEVVCYPRDMHVQGAATPCDPFAPVIIPGNHVYVKIGVSPPPGITVTLHALPPQFLLAVAYVETLVTETFGCGTLACGLLTPKAEKSSPGATAGASTLTTTGGREGSDASELSVSSHSSSSSSYSPASSSTSPVSGGGSPLVVGLEDLPESSPSLWSLDNITVTPLVFLHVVEVLCSYLWKTDVPALVKEYLLHLLAQTLRVLHYSEGCGGAGANENSSRLANKLSSKPSPTQGMLTALPRELKSLYDTEVKAMPEMSTSAGHGVGLGVTDTGRWSTYLQAVFEACLAISEVVPCEALHQPRDMPADTLAEEGAAGVSATLAKGGGSSLSSSGKKKKLKPKKERMAASARRSSMEQRAVLVRGEAEDFGDPAGSSGLMHASHSLADAHNLVFGAGVSGWDASSSAKGTSSNTSLCSGGSASSSSSLVKLEDMPWFPPAVSTSKILRYMALREQHCEEEVNRAVKFSAGSLTTPTAHTRLVIVTGIPTYLEKAVVERSVRKVCNSQGGLDSNRLFIPTPADIQALERQEKKELEEQAGITATLSLGSTASTPCPLPRSSASKSESSVSQPGSAVTPTNPSSTAEDLSHGSHISPRTPKAVGHKFFAGSSKLIEGYAVFSLPSKTKIEAVRRAFMRTKWLNLGEELEAVAAGGGQSGDDDDGPAGPSLLEAPEENLNVHTVNQQLLTEPEAMTALDKFLLSKLCVASSSSSDIAETDTSSKKGSPSAGGNATRLSPGSKRPMPGLELTKTLSSNIIGLNEAASQALTEVFYTCYFMDQGQQDSGDICLGRDQILNPAVENLLGAFFNAVRPIKKSLPEVVAAALHQYGIVKSRDKAVSPSSADKSSKTKVGKRPVAKSSKERLTLKDQEEKSQVMDKENKKDMDKEEREKPEKSSKEKEGATADYTVKESKSFPKTEGRLLTLNAFIKYCEDLMRQDLRALWRGIFACGFDLLFERCWCPDQAAATHMMREWTVERDCALVQHVNQLCCSLAVSTSRLHPHEVRLSQDQLAHESFTSLQGIPVESIRLRLAFLQQLNNYLETAFLPLVDLRPAKLYSRSTAYVLAQARWVIFYDTKINFFNRVLNASARRKPDQAAPEITLNPLESIGTGEKSVQSSILCQSYRQLSALSSRKLCVRLAYGGDPTYSFNVRMTGEEVHGTSGSFRHYLWQVARELQSPGLSLMMPCTGTGTKGRLVLKPGKMTYPEESLLLFVGQLLGITIRADIPLGLDLLSTVWKLLVGITLDPCLDLQEADAVTYKYIKRIEMAESEAELEGVLGEPSPRFVYTTLTGMDVELVPGGRATSVCWSNRQVYIDNIKRLRMRELASPYRVSAITTGLSSLLPIQTLTLLTPHDMEVRTSGRPHINLDFLKSHTMYQVGLVESDTHIEYFWTALESFSQEELARFIKFACNQERIPHTCPCQEGGPDSAHVPPYPMKIAPPDGTGPPDGRHIRVETCMFMVKLPQYSSLEVMASRLRYAINCREDPLSG